MKEVNTYGKLCTEFYALEKNIAPKEAFNFYFSYVKKVRGSILEPMCGTGRFLIPICERGYDIEGIDSSKFMIDECKKRCRVKKLNPILYELTIDQYKPTKRYNLIFIPMGSLGFISNKNVAIRSIKSLFNCLNNEGKLIVEIRTTFFKVKNEGKWISLRIKGKEKSQDNFNLCLKKQRFYDKQSQIVSTICVYERWKNNELVETETEKLKMYLYTQKEFISILTEVGFKNIKQFIPYNSSHTNLTKSASTLVFEATKIL